MSSFAALISVEQLLHQCVLLLDLLLLLLDDLLQCSKSLSRVNLLLYCCLLLLLLLYCWLLLAKLWCAVRRRSSLRLGLGLRRAFRFLIYLGHLYRLFRMYRYMTKGPGCNPVRYHVKTSTK